MTNKGVGGRQYFETHYSSRDWRFYRGILSIVISRSEPGRILDIGAGTGFFTEGALRWGFDCIGIEGSCEAIEIAEERYPGIKLQQLFLSGKLPFEGHTFQTIIMNQVIEHLEIDVAKNVLRESYRVLASKGMLLINSPGKYNKLERKADNTHIHQYSPKELEQLVRDMGFVDIVAMNSPLNLLGSNKISKALMRALHRLTNWDRLSASANCIAYKPEIRRTSELAG